MDDLISRQAAIDMFQNLAYDDWNQGVSTTRANAFAESADMIKGMPSAQPEFTEQDMRDEFNAGYACGIEAAQSKRKKGKWIEQDDGWDGAYYECSVCKEPFTLIDGTPQDNLYNFCPNCGAEMEK